MSDEVDPADPRPSGRYRMAEDATWYYVDDVLARSVAAGPATDAEPGDDWVLSFTAAGETIQDRERVCVRLTPRALHELYIETKDLDADARMAGHSSECALCGEQVDLDRAIPDGQGEPTHRRCWADAYGAPDWFIESQ